MHHSFHKSEKNKDAPYALLACFSIIVSCYVCLNTRLAFTPLVLADNESDVPYKLGVDQSPRRSEDEDLDR